MDDIKPRNPRNIRPQSTGYVRPALSSDSQQRLRGATLRPQPHTTHLRQPVTQRPMRQRAMLSDLVPRPQPVMHPHKGALRKRHLRAGYFTTRALGRLAVRHTDANKYRLHLLKRSAGSGARRTKKELTRMSFAAAALLVVAFELITIFGPNVATRAYALGQAETLLPKTSPHLAKKITHNQQEQVYNFNAGFVPQQDESILNGGPQISATLYDDPSKGITVIDPLNNVNFGLKPKFKLSAPKQQENRFVYPLMDGTGWLVYTLQATQAKEDIVLQYANGDKMTLQYEMVLDDGLEARLQKDGSIGIFGSDLPITGNVSTASEADAQLLQKARQTAAKNKLLFTLPAPIVYEYNKTKSDVKSAFKLLEGNILELNVSGLEKANYPLTIDPSVFVETAAQFMQGNNDSNIDFDVPNQLIQKGVLTGARIPSWSSTAALPGNRWGHGTIVAGGYIYIIGGNDGTNTLSSVYWAKIDPNNYTITAANPGPGPCATWCNNLQYDLPVTRTGASITTYNGYLYVIGGSGSGCSGSATICNTVYYSKIGANGEPNAWIANANTLTTNERKNASVVAYNNYIYLSGGQTNASQNGIDRIDYAPINPNGSIGVWTNTITQLPGSANADERWGHSMLQYNGYMYLIGGNQGGTLQNVVYYIKINSDGTFASSWVLTTPFSNPTGTGRQSFGGNFAQIWGGYLYVAGGCANITGQNCSSFLNDLQLASINADGSITDWTTITGVTLPAANAGHGFVAWRNTLYVAGGCAAMASGNCSAVVNTINYGRINNDGDVSPKQTETTLPAQGAGVGQIGRMSSGVIAYDGYIYNIGGCAALDCETMSDNSASAPINADGTLGAWTVDSTDTINGTGGLGAFGSTVYNGRAYVVGGTNGAADGWTRTITRSTLSAGVLSPWTAQTNLLPDVDPSDDTSGYGYQFVFARAASATTGNLYIISGCWADAVQGIGCTTYETDVLRCTITNSTGAVSGCTTTNQLQIQDLDASTAGSQGLGLTAGAIWGDYIYLSGGACGSGTAAGATAAQISCDGVTTSGTFNRAEINKIFVAKIDSSGNIVRADITTDNVWQIASHTLPTVRRREVSFAVNGYLYVAAGHNGTDGQVATLSDIAFAKINPVTGDISAFTSVNQNGTTNNIISPRWNLGYVAANGYLYFVGGCTAGPPPSSCTAAAGTVESVQVYNNYSGSPRAYTASASTIGVDRIGGSSVVLNGYLYFAGGCTNISCTTTTNSNYYAPINNDGTIGTWTASASALPAARAYGTLVAAGGSLYYIGGQNDSATAQSTIYYTSSISGSGAPTWAATATTKGIGQSTAASRTAQPRTQAAVATYSNRIYVVGGLDAAGTPDTNVYISPAQTGGGDITSDWGAASNLPATARSGASLVAYGSTLYLMGGYDGTNYLSDVQYASVQNNDGATVDVWNYSTSLPQPVSNAGSFAANGYLYLIGGRSAATTCTNNTYITPIIGSTPGSSVRYGIGQWSQTNVKFTGARYGAAVAYGSGRAYVMGGGCSAFVASTDRAYYGTLQAQPQISRFSIGIDSDIDVFPSNWLLNGVDNGNGARWSFSHRSATSGAGSVCAAMTTWGSLTSFGGVTLGRPGVYIPKDASGNNTNCAQYFYLITTIDASQSFGFPEDVSRGPTITDISFQFFSSPGRRLIHGKSFNGGLQQPLDTPCQKDSGNNADCILP